MSELNEESIKILSQLCRIEVSQEEFPSLFNDLKRIVEYIGQLQEIDVNHLSPHSHIEEQSISSLREDVPGEHLSRDLFLANAPDQVGGMIRIPPLFKQAT